MNPERAKRQLQDGRDEMNLADFPISALQRVQLRDDNGEKVDRLEYEATRYDPTTKQRLSQRVTLTTTAEEGLPTPADEHVVLALLSVAKHSNNFADVTVHFAPGQLFEIMGWAPNGRSYTRLRDVLRRLKALNIRYENAWWDAAGRQYEEEVATGIIAGYRIARQVSGPRTEGTELQSWVSWTPQFHESLKNGNIKRLNLEVYFSLSSPTAQRMYRFLDKRLYNSPRFAMDLVEFACGHIGLTESHNVAILKRRLASAIEELEGIQFIERMTPEERYLKVKPGVWRIHFQTVSPPSPPKRGRGGQARSGVAGVRVLPIVGPVLGRKAGGARRGAGVGRAGRSDRVGSDRANSSAGAGDAEGMAGLSLVQRSSAEVSAGCAKGSSGRTAA